MDFPLKKITMAYRGNKTGSFSEVSHLVGSSDTAGKCPKGKAGKACRQEKWKDIGRKATVALGGLGTIFLGTRGYKKGDGDWVR